MREFEILKKSSGPPVAVKRGFCWPGFFFTWIWAFSRGLWLHGFIILFSALAAGGLVFFGLNGNPVAHLLVSVGIQIIVGLKGHGWRSRKLEDQGYSFVRTLSARSSQDAVSAFSRGKAIGTAATTGWLAIPGWLQRLLAIAALTWKAALRFKLFLVLMVMLLVVVVGLPLLIKDDGTARGFTQILLTYTLSVVTAFLGLATLWLSCGTLARDIEECQIQMLDVKPIARWQIWLGKWLGIVSLNAVLLVVSGACIYGLLFYRAQQLPPEEQQVLRDEVLVARSSVQEESYEDRIQQEADRIVAERLRTEQITQAEIPLLLQQTREQLKAPLQVVRPGGVRPWVIDLGSVKDELQDQPLFLRIKFNSAERVPTGTTFMGLWQVGVPETPQLWRSEMMSLAPDTFHEFEVPPNLLDEDGMLYIVFLNPNDATLLFSLEDGLQVLYREGGFALNFARGLGIIFCWLALLAAIGLTAATFLSFPVAAFFSFSLLIIVFSSGTLASVVEEGTLMGVNEETGAVGYSILDNIAVPLFAVLLKAVRMVEDFSPIDALSTGRSIAWPVLGQAVLRIVVLFGGVIALIGVWLFHRRELATAQGTQ